MREESEKGEKKARFEQKKGKNKWSWSSEEKRKGGETKACPVAGGGSHGAFVMGGG